MAGSIDASVAALYIQRAVVVVVASVVVRSAVVTRREMLGGSSSSPAWEIGKTHSGDNPHVGSPHAVLRSPTGTS